MNLQPAFQSILLFALLIYFIIRQVTPRKPSRFRFYFMPVVGVIMAYQYLPKPMVPMSQVADAVVSCAIGIVFGILQARYTRIYETDGVWMMKGDWRYLLTWVVLLIVRAAVAILFGHMGHTNNMVIEWIIWLEIAVVWGVRSLVLHARYPQLRAILAKKK